MKTAIQKVFKDTRDMQSPHNSRSSRASKPIDVVSTQKPPEGVGPTGLTYLREINQEYYNSSCGNNDTLSPMRRSKDSSINMDSKYSMLVNGKLP